MFVVPVFTAKVVGTMSIGLWAGYNLSLLHRSPESASPKDIWSRFFRCESWKNVSPGKFSPGKISAKLQALVSEAQNIWSSKCCNAASPSLNGEPSLRRSSQVAAQGSKFTASDLITFSVRALHVSALSGLAFAANFIAYMFAGASGKHPYLLYLALGAPLVGALQYYGARKLYLKGQFAQKGQPEKQGEPHSESEEDTEIVGDLSASTYEHVKHPNSENSSVAGSEGPDYHEFTLEHKYSIFSSVVAGLSTFLYLISVIGLAGDPGRL